LENGRLGEVIRVKNKESQKVVFAKVSGERLVEVSY
jgi:flagella basal body P-ring formation protein FlgA